MARVHFVKKARKDNPVVKAGEPYYWWKFRFGGKHFSKTYPKPSQLTQSEFLSTLYSLQEQREDACTSFAQDMDFDSFKANIEAIADELEALGQECEDKHYNMPEGLQEGEIGQLLEERSQRCESMSDELRTEVDNTESELEEVDPNDEVTIECPHCGDEEDFDPDFRGVFCCQDCEEDYVVTDDMVKEKLQERANKREELLQDVLNNVEGVDMDCE